MNSVAKKNIKIQQLVVIVAILLFILKMGAWYLTGSLAILTDGLESTVNVISGFFGLYSLYLSAKPRDEDHPYGHGKIEFISAALEGILITLAGCLIIYESVRHFISPTPVAKLSDGLILIIISAVINYAVGWVAIRQGQRNSSVALLASGRHLQTDTYSTIGICIGLVLYHLTGKLWLDPATAVVFAFLIIFNGISIIRTSVAGIMDESDKALLTGLVSFLNEIRRTTWVDLHNLRVVKYGSILHIDCHLTVPWYLNVHQAHDEIAALDKSIKEKYGESIEMFVHSDGCLDFSCRICALKDCAERKHPFENTVIWTVENISSNRKHGSETNTNH